jgi:hypothetical protein
MTLRRRLAIWYGAVLAIVLTASLGLAYALHAESHDADVDAALASMIARAETEIDAQLASGVPLAALDLTTLNRAIDEPHAAWLVVDGRAVASAGMTSDLAFTDAAVTDLSDGWYTLWTVDGRVRAYARSLGFGRLVTAADLSVIDAANADLRMAYVILGLLGVGVGTAIAS